MFEMHLILTGATGRIGSAALDAMIKSKSVSKITILSRRPIQAAEDANDPRINVIIHEDFMKYDDALLERLTGADGVVWALGTSVPAVGQKYVSEPIKHSFRQKNYFLTSSREYIKITKEYAIAAARAFRRIPQHRRKPFRFIYVARGHAANDPEALRPFAARVKAEAILTLAEMRRASPMFHASTVRPEFLQHSEQNTNGDVPSQAVATAATERLLLPLIRASLDRGWRPTEPVGRFLAAMVVGKLDGALLGLGVKKIGAFPIVENADVRQLMSVGG